ncbi:PREDICTED: uncharacterized protein LOC108758474 [Trachymyrmex cornetzi]|uniref:uncharacterized protein LOC108758474 n=1 Tax=Trachymyrmex cornetzi TaxID=471704 RepID=UPI00084F3A2B|nr:PREDICTED: uncharacterized protein LOC108758474 [Trachymyrmex cornetzi]
MGIPYMSTINDKLSSVHRPAVSSYHDGGTRGFRRYFNGQTRSIELAQLFETQRHKDALSTIRRGLLLLFHPLLASKISWKGYNNNFKFEDTKTAQILCETVQTIFKINMRKIEIAIINWFRHSKDKKSNKDKDNAKDENVSKDKDNAENQEEDS